MSQSNTSEASAPTTAARKAELYRMVMPKHRCPYGLKALHLLKQRGFEVVDHHLTTREETDALKARFDVKTTPQIVIDGRRIGGYDDLRRHFGLNVPAKDAVSYQPVLAVFLVAALLAAAMAIAMGGAVASVRTIEAFVAISMCLLAMLKLQDIETFSTMFLNYDLLAQRWVPYGRIYPFAELGAGVLMLAGVLNWVSIPVALVIGSVGAVSVYKAVFIDKRDIKCACVGGSGRVPLGFVSLTENVAMVAMALWMWAHHGLV